MATKAKKKNTDSEKTKHKYEMVFDKHNYNWMMIGFGIIVLGFVLMYG